jgi:protocatechuate 3,4-dioxygenase beta subunit
VGGEMKLTKFLAVLLVFSMLLSPFASFPVGASDPNDPDGDDDNDSDGYDSNRDGVLSDEEKYTNLEEYYNNTNPNDEDTDDGGAWDGWEIYYGFNPRNASDDSLDSDDDFISNSIEFYWDSDPFDSDTDQDGMPDGWEDFYSDRVPDGCGLNPTVGSDKFGDPDGDGSDNLREYQEGTDPCDEDSDDDGVPDGEDPPPLEPGEPPGTNPDTGATDGNVTIYEIFDPVLGSLKRWSSLNGLYYDSANSNPYTMYNYDTTKTEIFPTNYEGYSQIFEGWIWMGITVTESSYTMIPSVSPDAEIIDYDSNATGVTIQFFKDGADNYYVQSNQEAIIDLRYRMGTNGSYFNREISDDLTLDDMPEEVIIPITGESEVKENVKEFLQYRHDNGTIANEPLYWLWPENGIPETNLALIINNLTWYFSAFIEGDGDVPDPEPPWDIYQSICINGIGACRHRSFGFFVTALALGSPTRYVSNEAHAFVEVYVPEDNETFSTSHWKRINLGGTGGSNTLERPDEEDDDGDTFNFDEMDPDDIDNMTGDPVIIVIESYSPTEVDKGEIIRIQGYVEDENGTRLPNFPLGFGMWDDGHDEPAFEIGQSLTDDEGNFDANLTDFLAAIPGENEIYAASYKKGFLGVDGPENIEISSSTTLIINAPESVGKGQELVISGILLDIGGVPAEGETVEFEIWESPKHWNSNRCTSDYRFRCDIGTSTTDEFGNFVFSWTVPENGQPDADDGYTIETDFTGSTYLYSTENTTGLVILESTVNLTAEIAPAEEYIGNKFWINGTVDDVAISNGNISIEMVGFELAKFSVTHVNWTTELFIPTDFAAGDYTVIVTFDSESITLPDERINLNFTVLGTSNIILDSDSLKITRGNNVTLEGELQDHLGQPLSEQSINLVWNEITIATVTTETDGDFIYNYNIPSNHVLGNVTWSAEFIGNDLHSGSSESQTSVIFQQTVLTLQSDNIHFYAGESMLVSGSLALDNGTLISGTLGLYFNDIYLESFQTNGNFSFEYIPDSTYLDVGLQSIQVKYSEKEYNLADTASVDVYLHRQVFITTEEQQVLRDTTVQIEGFARDESSFGIAGLELSFIWGDNTLDETSTTNFGGSYSKEYLIPNAQLLGKVVIQVIFDNTTSPFHDNATQEVEFTVWSETVIYLPDIEIIRGAPVWFNGTIFDDRGQPVEEIEVNIFWNEDYINRITGDSNGTFSFICEEEWECSESDHPVGIIPVELDFGGIGYYRSSNYIANYTIWGHTNISISEFSEIVIAGNNVTFTGFIENDLGVPLDREITVRWDGITRTTVSSINGDFSGTFVLPENTLADNHTLSVVVDDQNFLRGSSDSVQILVMRETEVTLQWLGGFRNSSSMVSGYLRDVVGIGLLNHQLDVYFDGEYIGNTTSGESGMFSYDIFIDESTELGGHAVEIRFEGSYLYISSSLDSTSDILARTAFSSEPLEVLRLQEFILSSYLLDDLGNPMVGQMVNVTFRNIKYPLIVDDTGLVEKSLILTPDYDLGTYSAYWDYSGHGYYLPTTHQQIVTIMALTSISIESDADVIVGETFSFSGRIIDDMNEPLSTNLNFYFHGQFVDTLVTDGDGKFYYEYRVPTDSDAGPNAISVHYISEGYYRASSSTWQLQVYHNTRIVMNDFEGILDTTVPITGYAYDKADRPINNLSIRLVLDSGFPIDGVTDSNGKFSIPLPLPFGLELGNHNLTATFAGNNFYINNFTSSNIFIKGETQIFLKMPNSLEYQQAYSGEIVLSMYDGTPVSGASLLVNLEPEGMTFMVITDLNGTATFDSIFSGNMTIPMVVKVTYTGSENYIGNVVESSIVYRPPVEQSNYSFWIIMAASLVGASGVILGWKWYRERHLREIQRILEATALALEANMDYRDSIVYSYKEMCKILNGYGYLRRHFETVREFQHALQEALSLDHDSVARLTLLYEEADYTTKSLDDDHRLNAVSSLRTVIQSLDDYTKKEE